MFLLSIFIYCIGVFIFLLSMKNERITYLLIWPYLIYGTGLVFAMYNYEYQILSFTNLYDYNNIFLSQLIMLSVVICVFLLDKIFFTNKFLRNKINKMYTIENPIVVKIVNSNIYRLYVLVQSIILIGLLMISWYRGDIGIGEYSKGFYAPLWGAVGFFVENLVISVSLYIYSIFFFSEKVRRNKYLEILLLITFIFRLLFGTRLFLAKIIIMYLLMYLICKKKYLKIIKFSFILIVFLSIIAFFRLGYYDNNIEYVIFSSLFAEMYYNDLTLLIATKSLEISNFIYQPFAVITFFSGLIPSFLFDRTSFINEYYNQDIILQSLGVSELAPLGAMSFLAELIYAWGWGYFIGVFISVLTLILFIRKLSSSYGIFIIFAIGEMSINLWRDSFVIAIKIFVVHVLINLLVIYVLYCTTSKRKVSNKENIL